MGIFKKLAGISLSFLLAFPFIGMGIPAHADEGQASGLMSDSTTATDFQLPVEDSVPIQEDANSGDSSAVKAASDSVEFIYIDSAQVSLGEIQNIAVGLQDAQAEIIQAKLHYRQSETGEDFSIKASAIAGNSVLFSRAFSEEGDIAGYEVIGMTYTLTSQNASHETCYIDFTLDVDAKYSFTVSANRSSSVAELPDVESDIESEAELTAYTIGENGNLTEKRSIDEALKEPGVQTPGESLQANRSGRHSAMSFLDPSVGVQGAAVRGGNIVIALDPGHGGSDSGAAGYGLLEKDLNLKIALYCKAKLEQYAGISVYLTRTSDTSVGLTERVDNAINAGASIFVSIHINAGGGTGAEVWIPNESSYNHDTHIAGTALGDKIVSKLAELGLTNRGVKIRDSEYYQGEGPFYDPSGHLADFYTVINQSRAYNVPGIIVEHAFIDGYEDAQRLGSDSFLRSLGEADAVGIMESGVAKKAELTVNPVSSCVAGSPIAVFAPPSSPGTRYNYCWMRTDLPAWQKWGHLQDGDNPIDYDSVPWTPTEPGSYVFWCDITTASGVRIKTADYLYTVRPDYALNALTLSSSSVSYGEPIAAKVDAAGDISSLKYNYCWMRTDLPAWQKWGHLQEGDGSISSSSLSWTPPEPGSYALWCDAIEPSGLATKSPVATLVVNGDYSIDGFTTSSSFLETAGKSVDLTVGVSGNAQYLTYNYCWMRTDLPAWQNWGHVQPGDSTKDNVISWTPSEAGEYTLWCDVIDSRGMRTKTQNQNIEVKSTFLFSGLTGIPSSQSLGKAIDVTANTVGYTQNLRYNYCWMRTDLPAWQSWGHLQPGDDPVSSGRVSWMPSEPGAYTLWCDAIDSATGYRIKSADVSVIVTEKFSVSALTLSTGSVVAGSPLQATVQVSGDTSGLQYNYCWMRTDVPAWQSWGHLQPGDDPISSNSVSWTPRGVGSYVVWCDVVDPTTGYRIKSADMPLVVTGGNEVLRKYPYSLSAAVLNQVEKGISNYTEADYYKYMTPSNYPIGSSGHYQFARLDSGYSGITALQIDMYIAQNCGYQEAITKRLSSLRGMGSAIVQVSKDTGVNEVYILAHAILESGWGCSRLATGTVSGYENYYNFYGIGAYDLDPNNGGAALAKKNGWTTPQLAIAGGAKWISSNYLEHTWSLGDGTTATQNTLYKMRYAPGLSNTWHQYATGITWSTGISSLMSKIYADSGVSSLELDYEVPLYL